MVHTSEGLRRGQIDAGDDGAVRNLHEALLTDRIPWFVDSSNPPVPELAPRFIKIGAELDAGLTGMWQGRPVDFVYDEGIALAAPKVRPALAEVARQVDTGAWQVAGALVFNTHRDHRPGVHETANEPVAVGPVLAQLIGGLLEIEVVEDFADYAPALGRPQVAWFDYLQGRESLTRDGVLNSEMLDRIDGELYRLAVTGVFDAVVAILDGGIPLVKDFLLAAAEFRFPQVFELRTPSAANETVTGQHSSYALHPAQAVRLRKTASDLVRSQDFYGAHSVARLAEHDSLEGAWVRQVDALHAILAGLEPPVPACAAWPDYLQTWTVPLPRCAIQALRVESALTRGAVADAVIYTVSFAEAAQRDLLEECLRKRLGRPDLKANDLSRRFDHLGHNSQNACPVCQELYGRIAESFPSLVAGVSSRDRCVTLEPFQNGSHALNYGSSTEKDQIWRDVLIREEALSRFFGRLFPGKGSDPKMSVRAGGRRQSARDIRNVLSHSNLLPCQLAEIHREFVRLGIWCDAVAATPPGGRFLRQAEVSAILAACGIPLAAEHYSQLLAGILATIARR